MHIILMLEFLTLFVFERQKNLIPIYQNDLNEFVYFYGDSVQFKIFNNDAFGLYSMGKGRIERSRNNQIKLNFNTLIYECSTMQSFEVVDSAIEFKILYHDGSPMSFAQIDLYDKKKQLLFAAQVNNDGKLLLDVNKIGRVREQVKFVTASYLGFKTSKEIDLTECTKHVIKSRIPKAMPFSLYASTQKLKIQYCDASSLVVLFGGTAHKLVKREVPLNNGKSFLFDKICLP